MAPREWTRRGVGSPRYPWGYHSADSGADVIPEIDQNALRRPARRGDASSSTSANPGEYRPGHVPGARTCR